MYCVGAYEGRLRLLIQLFKYESMERLGKPLGTLLRSGYPRELSFDCLVPMPIHRRRRRERGFNQAEVLALELTQISQLPVEKLVVRRRHTAKQAGLSGKECPTPTGFGANEFC
jgi:predicted amidophosphoribosyltransferase